MKRLTAVIAILMMSSCSELSLKRMPASEPAEFVVAESFNEVLMKDTRSAPKGFHLTSCSLRSVRKNSSEHFLKKKLRLFLSIPMEEERLGHPLITQSRISEQIKRLSC